jgi:tripartite-type tricarboxylate transporter receptor subunit TctC
MKTQLASVLMAAAMIVGTDSLPATAESYPSETIRLIVPYPPGGSTDTVGRIWAEGVSRHLGRVIVENHPGAATNIGSEMVARAAPDGHTLLVASFANTVNPSLQPDIPFDARTDLTPVTMISRAPNILVVNPDFPAGTLEELIEYARENPGQMDYGSGGIGSSAHMTLELLKNMAGLDIMNIPYPGGPAALVDVINGTIAMSADMPQTLKDHIEAGSVRPLAVTSTARHPDLPDVPTVHESGVEGFNVVAWHGIVAPGGTPEEVMNQIHEATVAALQDPDVVNRLAGLGLEPVGSSPEEFTAFFLGEIDLWSRVVEEGDIRPE